MEQKHGSVSITRYIRTKSNLMIISCLSAKREASFESAAIKSDTHRPSKTVWRWVSATLWYDVLLWRAAISPPYRKKPLCPRGKTSESFFFLFSGIHLPLSGNMSRMYKILRENNLLDYSFLQLLTNLNEIWHALPWKHNVRWIAQCNVTVSLNFSLQSSPKTGCLLELYSFIFLYNGGTYLKQ